MGRSSRRQQDDDGPADRPVLPEHLEVVETDGGLLFRRDGRDQSFVDVTDPARLPFDYVRRLADALDVLAPPGEPLRVVHVGGAGLSLPRYLAATRPGSRQTVLEPDEALTAAVREVAPLPARSGIRVRPVLGRPGLEALAAGEQREGADVVVLDAFDDGRVPADLASGPGLRALAAVLAPHGTALLNVADEAPFALARDVLAAVREHLPQVCVSAEPATLRGRRPGNLVVVASRAPVPVRALEERARRGGAPYRVLDAAAVSDTLGGGSPRPDPA
ncbi:spermidine synthase [Nocardioides bruguierae]|uniref:Fused MFS/spermidine synthase n=1 Tax=Nocardioides bruguierae TaxID=2945102 RepID=A0A9X2IEX6_9ACTN|nr:fused MFS/spermidine synthase [Nocardioides bruguierae]MCM0619090.1 fused MFS/spermidine synthase [Nocardioides bruguierae]